MQLIGQPASGKTLKPPHAERRAVANLSLAFNYGRKGRTGSARRSGFAHRCGVKTHRRAGGLLPAKGQAVVVTLDDAHRGIPEARRQHRQRVGRHGFLELAGRSDGGGGQQQGAAPAAKPAPAPAARPTAPPVRPVASWMIWMMIFLLTWVISPVRKARLVRALAPLARV